MNRIDYGWWFMWVMLLLPAAVMAIAVAAWLGRPAVSIIIAARMTPAHQKAWQRLTEAIRRVDTPDGLACQAAPEEYWPGLVRLGPEMSAAMKRECRRCPVQAECLAMGRFERFGVWGGSQFIDGRAVDVTRCTWCGHPSHTTTCTSSIHITGGKKPTTAPCPCNHHRKDQ